MKELITKGAAELGVDINETQAEQLVKYAELLKEWNEKMNLTAITDDEGIAVKHFLDSMTALSTGRIGKKVIDVGTGAGFPGLVLKIMKPEIELTLLDSLNKRINFLKTVADELGLDGIEFVHARAEDGGANRAYRAKYDTVVSRAVANMKVLSEWCIPFLKEGGYFLALKGPLAGEELDDAKRAISILGGKVDEVYEADIPFSELHHKIIIVKKVRQTPMRFPRKPGIAAKTAIEQCYKLRK
jgi:16S rRNA (guanine527-N7)-methyltransferase